MSEAEKDTSASQRHPRVEYPKQEPREEIFEDGSRLIIDEHGGIVLIEAQARYGTSKS